MEFAEYKKEVSYLIYTCRERKAAVMGKNFDEEYDEQETNLFDFLRECSESEKNNAEVTSDKREQDRETAIIGVKESEPSEPEDDDKQIYINNEDYALYEDDAEDYSNYYTDDSSQNSTGDNYIDYAKKYSDEENGNDGLKQRRNSNPHTFSLTFVIIMTAVITAAAVIAGFGLLSGFDFGGFFGEESSTETEKTGNTANIQLPVTDDNKQTELQSDAAAGEKKLQIESALEAKGSLTLVNYAHEYMFPEADLVNLYSAKNSSYKISTIDIMLDRKTVEALNSMAEDFEKETGKRDLLVSSGFRSYDEQLELYSSAVESKGIDYAKNHISQPGYSEYHTGLSFDMSVYTDNGAVIKLDESEEYSWILEHCWEYGFVRRFDDAKSDITGVSGKEWLFRYVGRPAAYLMTTEGISLEEYIELVMTKDYKHRLGYNEKSGKRYEVYFVPISDSDYTDITVPEESGVTYDISGTNCGGFIVTLSFD